jgi:hypothetical protein
MLNIGKIWFRINELMINKFKNNYNNKCLISLIDKYFNYTFLQSLILPIASI